MVNNSCLFQVISAVGDQFIFTPAGGNAPATYNVGKRFAGEPYTGPDYLGNPINRPSAPGKISYAILVYKMWIEGTLRILHNSQEDLGYVEWPGHKVVWQENNGDFIFSIGGRRLSSVSEAIMLSALGALKLRLFDDPNVQPRYFCDAIYYGFANVANVEDSDAEMSVVEKLFKDLQGNSIAYVGTLQPCDEAPAQRKARKKKAVKKAADEEWEAIKRGEYRINYPFPEDVKDKIIPSAFLEDYIPTELFMNLVHIIKFAYGNIQERVKNGIDWLEAHGDDVVNPQLLGPVGTGKTFMMYALSAVFGVPLFAVTAQPDQGVELIEGETKMVGSELTFVRAQLSKAAEMPSITCVDEAVIARTEQLFSAFAEYLEYPYHFYENGYKEIKRHPMAVCCVCYNTGGRTFMPALTSRFAQPFYVPKQERETFIELLMKYNEGVEYEYDREKLCAWVYEAYERTIRSLTQKRKTEIVSALSLRACRGMLTAIAAGETPDSALRCLWGIVAHYNETLAEELRKDAYDALPDLE